MELKIAFLIIVIGVSNVFATPSYSQRAKVSLDMESKSLEKVIDEIEKQSEFYFIFNQKQIDVQRLVDIQADNKLITEILPTLFKGTNINYSVLDRKILLTTDPLLKLTEQQSNEVYGTVKDSQGRPMVGVNVIEKGTTNGTLTTVNGNYTILVASQTSTLVFKFVGMISQEVVVGSNTNINITMAEDIIGMEEVVVIGYGTAKKTDLTGAVAIIKPD